MHEVDKWIRSFIFQKGLKFDFLRHIFYKCSGREKLPPIFIDPYQLKRKSLNVPNQVFSSLQRLHVMYY